MRCRVAIPALLILLTLVAAGHTGAPPAAGPVVVLTVEGAIDPAVADYLVRGIHVAADRQAQCVILRLDTPGGLETSMRKIGQAFLGSSVPVVVYVWPSGGRAASAGAIIALAAHVVAMAPGTNIGAAHPVAGGGEEMSKTMSRKVEEDAAAYARSLAEKRGRNIDWANKVVRESISSSETEALRLGVIDLIAPSLPALLEKLNGRVVQVDDREVTLNTRMAAVTYVNADWREQFLHLLANPNLAYLLMLLAIYGIIFELQSPGAVFPGVVGSISLILALYSLSVLPVNVAGLALIIVGVALFIIDIKAPSHGVLSAGGVVAFGLGSLMLFRPGESGIFRVSVAVVLAATVVTALFFIFVVGLAVKAQRGRWTTGKEGLIGKRARALTRLAPEGSIQLAGEIWKAETEDETIEPGQTVEVTAVDGLTAKVKSAPR
jgi:membrane-bound serine protease (ClpP class)